MMNSNWEIIKIGAVLEFINGRSFKKTEWRDNGIPIIRIQNLNNPKAEFNYFQNEYDKRIEVNNNDLLFSWSGTVGSSFGPHIWTKGKGVLNQHIFKVIIKKDLDKRYAYYSLKFITKEIERKVNGAVGLAHITKSKLNDFEIVIPPVEEQRRIVGILDEAFEKIDKAKENVEKNLQNSQELFGSYLQNIFSNSREDWHKTKLSSISKIRYGYTEKSSYKEIGPKFLRITDIQNNQVNWENVPYCKCSNQDLKKYKLFNGDIVFARTGATTGKSFLLNNPPESVFASYLIRLQLNDKSKILPEFVYYYFQTSDYWNTIKSGLSGSAQGGFNASKLGNLLLSYPKSLTEQEEIVEKLSRLSEQTIKLEEVYKQKLKNLDELKKSILNKAFAGEL